MTESGDVRIPLPRHSILVAGLVTTLVLISGCGGSSQSDPTAKFTASYEADRGQLKQTSAAVGAAIQQSTSQTDAQIITAFRGLAGRWQSQLSQLQTLKPPSNLSADFNTLTGAATRVEADLNAIVSAAATHSTTAAEQAGASVVTDITSAKSADTTITQKLGVK